MINWAILGAGNIAHRFAKGLSYVSDAHLYAIANRTTEKAKKFQQQFPTEKIYTDYDALLRDPNIDLVYIALPHLYHYEWIIKALRQHKGVLCEKPATINTEQMTKVIETAREEHVFFMEAMKNRFTPAFQKLQSFIKAGKLGKITQISTALCRIQPKATSTYHYLPIQGGCLLDMGIYNASFITTLTSNPLKIDTGDFQMLPNGVETNVDFKLSGGGIHVVLKNSFIQNLPVEASVIGIKGKLEVPNFHRPASFIVTQNGQTQTFDIPYDHDDFYSEIVSAMDTFKKGEIENPIMPFTASMKCIQLIQQLKTFITKNA